MRQPTNTWSSCRDWIRCRTWRSESPTRGGELFRCFEPFALDNVGRCHDSPHLHDGGSGLALREEDAEAIESPEPGLPEPEDDIDGHPGTFVRLHRLARSTGHVGSYNYDFAGFVDFDAGNTHTGSGYGLDRPGHVLLPEYRGCASHDSTGKVDAQSFSAPAEGRIEIVETVADWAERGLIKSPICGDGAGRVLDRRRRRGERDHLAAGEQPDQTSLVITR